MKDVDIGFDEAIAGLTPQEMLDLAQRLERRAKKLRHRAGKQARQKRRVLFKLEDVRSWQN